MRQENFVKVLVIFDNTEVEVVIDEEYFKKGYGLPVGYTEILNTEIVTLPVYEKNDRVIVDVCRGTVFDEDGQGNGGKWITLSGVVTDVYPRGYNGFVQFDNGDCNSSSLIHGYRAWPSSNIRAENFPVK